MRIDGISRFFVPTDKKFLPLFKAAADNLVAISKVLVDLLGEKAAAKRVAFTEEIIRLEHVGDDITHEVLSELNATLITPFDPEDIHKLAAALDDVADNIHKAAKKLHLYGVSEPTPAMKALAELIQKSADEVHVAINELSNLHRVHRITEAVIKIKKYEDTADDISEAEIGRLFAESSDVRELIKEKEVLEVLEIATDRCDDVANTLESIVIKTT